MNSNCKFSTYNPIINFIFFITAIVLGMVFMHPVYLLVSLFCAMIFYITIAGRESIKLFIILLPFYLLITFANGFITTAGDTVLFVYLNRNFTYEALFYGFLFANMFSEMIIWFASYSKIMTSDKFIYIFGPIMPSISLIFTMVLRFVPRYKTQAVQIATARKCIGKADPFSIVSAMTTWAFENGLTTADSMKSRGYGSKKRTHFSIYKFGISDILLLAIMIFLTILVVFTSVKGATFIEIIPSIEMAWFDNPYLIIGVVAYGILLLIPSFINVKEVLLWQILRSRI